MHVHPIANGRIHREQQAAFAALFEVHYAAVFRLLVHMMRQRADAEDLAQDVFVALHRECASRGQPPDVRRWLLRVALNRGLNALRGQRRRVARERASSSGAAVYDLEGIAVRRQAQHRVRETLAQLEPRAAKLLMLRQLGLRYAEIAKILNVAPGSIGNLQLRAQRAFMHLYCKRYGDDAVGGQR